MSSSESSSSSSLKEQLTEAARLGNVALLRQLLQGVEAGGEQVTAGGAPAAVRAASNSRISTPQEPRSSCSSSSSSFSSQVTEARIGDRDPAYDDPEMHQINPGFLRKISPDGGSLLHVVAASGDRQNHRDCAMAIHEKDKTLLLERNDDDETALDCAAKARHSNMVLHLLHLERESDQSASDAGAARGKEIVEKMNGEWETELHRAVRQRDDGELERLGREDRGLARVPDIHGMPPLYLAVLLGYSDIVENLISAFGDDLSYDGPNGQNALHAAALRSADLTRIIVERSSPLRTKADCSGNIPLHFAASVGVKGITSSLLDGDTGRTGRRPDKNGMYPIHIAASVGVMDPIYSLVKKDLSCATLRDAHGRTLLHIAVENGKCNVVKFVCDEPTGIFKDSLNMKDGDGNTALHLAVKKRDKFIFGHLLGKRDVELNHVNMEGYTPLDLASKIKVEHPFASPQNPTEWMIRALAHSGAQFSPRRHDEFISANNSEKRQEHGAKLAESTESVLVASALIATLTFAAAFTMPGSYKTGEATPALGALYGFKVFLVADMFAFYFSVAATFSLAEYGNRRNVDPLVRCAYARRSVWLFHVALKSVIVAFAFGVSVVMWEVSASAIAIVAAATAVLVLYGNVPLAHDFRLVRVMYRRFGFSRSWDLRPSTSSRLGWTSWRLTNFVVTLGWNLVKLFWAYGLIFLVAYIAQLRQKS